MVCQKVCEQDRDDIIVNLQHPIPTSFYITVANWCENDAGTRLCKFTFSLLYHPYLVCILFGMPSLHPFTFVIFFKSCQLLTSSSLSPRDWQFGIHYLFTSLHPVSFPSVENPGTMLPLCTHMVQYWPCTDHRGIPFHESTKMGATSTKL